MTKAERDIQCQLNVLRHAEKIGDIGKTYRCFGIGRSSHYRWKASFGQNGGAGLIDQKPIPKNPANQTPPEIVNLTPRCIGRPKGGLNLMLHALCDGGSRPIVRMFADGQMSDHKGTALAARDIAPCVLPKSISNGLLQPRSYTALLSGASKAGGTSAALGAKPMATALTAACVRLETPSLTISERTLNLTTDSSHPSRLAITLFGKPSLK